MAVQWDYYNSAGAERQYWRETSQRPQLSFEETMLREIRMSREQNAEIVDTIKEVKGGKVCTLFLLCFPSLCMLQNLVREWLVWRKVWKNLKEVF